MPLVARKDGVDIVNTIHVSVGDRNPKDGIACDAAPQDITTDEGSGDVFAEGVGVVRKDDNEQSHTFPGCATHQTGLATHSPDVFANGKPIGRLGDTYTCSAKITNVTQGTVFANGE